MIRIEHYLFLDIVRMSYEMETAEKKQESQLVINHLRNKLTSYSGLYWNESLHYHQRRIEFDAMIWYPCMNCTNCIIIEKLAKGYSHLYLNIKTHNQSIIVSQVL